MIQIEPYSDLYFLDVLKIVENFHKESVIEYDATFDVQAVIRTIKTQTETNANGAFLLIVDGKCEGLLFGVQTKSLLNDSQMFQEIIWYVNKPFRRYGVNLLREVENRLKLSGVSTMIMAVMENSKTEKIKSFYKRLGYKPMETHFVRTL